MEDDVRSFPSSGSVPGTPPIKASLAGQGVFKSRHRQPTEKTFLKMRPLISKRTKNQLARKLPYNFFLRLLLQSLVPCCGPGFSADRALSWPLFHPEDLESHAFGFSAGSAGEPLELDRVQAWALKRTTRRDVAAGQGERAHYAWLAAAANNPADTAAVRGLLGNYLKLPFLDAPARRLAISQSLWLLRLTRTNASDRPLVRKSSITVRPTISCWPCCCPTRTV